MSQKEEFCEAEDLKETHWGWGLWVNGRETDKQCNWKGRNNQMLRGGDTWSLFSLWQKPPKVLKRKWSNLGTKMIILTALLKRGKKMEYSKSLLQPMVASVGLY